MKSDGVKKNFIYQFMYQVVVLITPLITAPYLARVLGESNLGIYSYTYSIAYYFVIIGMLGITKYGQRIIATRKHNEVLLRKTFWSLFFVHCVTSFIGVSLYLGFCLLFCDDNKSVYIVQTMLRCFSCISSGVSA